ncbi:Gfo/Idh/MocA family oxidoreductase [Akkermansiaceae bacterium]|nr:Gfo/Idh/MocA family oxidoreductase [bacterium]MDA7629504.1 Gfo/Idh/MocA family oxidoreductase [Akkermansiaceae bacterium]MDB4283270.1 Gfo/Idh/MocA family oxidoreductase [Akkermansiaceae bacterium]MDB4332364.1 Gfo/Idh/MocA family oxidoreductase [Akkermansiaceae bacterium]MDB4386732.1 Gfo/Idh/MocA family oxidoreductase [Akkermansiaceae bacterium]
MSDSPQFSRRKALKGLASLATISIVPSRVLGLNGQTPPSEELTRGILGCGGISNSHLKMPGRILALCDVDSQRLAQRTKQAVGMGNKDAKMYHDFREVIAREDIDIIHTCTPPHWHAHMAIAAAKAGKHVWGEKPMSRTIGEGQAMVKAIQEADISFRLNTWFRFKSDFYGSGVTAREVKKAVDGGLIGDGPYKVTLSGHTGFNWKFMWSGKTDLQVQQVPGHFDYDTWLGPAPYRPYNSHRTHGTFRGYWDYDGGGLGDMGQHYLDPIQYILGKDDELPVSVEVDADPQDSDAVGSFRRITYTYADGTSIVLDGENKDKDAAFIQGSDGKIMKGFKSDVAGFAEKVKTLPEPEAQVTDFHQAIREKKKFALNEQNGFNSCTLINLGKIAHRLNTNLKFDPKAMKFIDNPLADSLITQPDREKWALPV